MTNPLIKDYSKFQMNLKNNKGEKMKKLMLLLALTISAVVSANVSIVDTDEAVTQALVDFQSSASADKVAKFNGVKAWPVSGGVKVKIYVKGSDSVDLSCHRHSDSEPFECH